MKKLYTLCAMIGFVLTSSFALADDYVVDVKGAHAFVRFKASHLGYSWLYGDFKRFDGEFTYDANDDSKNKVWMTVDMTSISSNHGERDIHLKTKDFVNAEKFNEAKFVSKKYLSLEDGKASLIGDLTFLGVTKEITFDVDVIGGGRDPWGGERQGFEATTVLNTGDFGMQWAQNFPTVELIVSVEGCKKPNENCNNRK